MKNKSQMRPLPPLRCSCGELATHVIFHQVGGTEIIKGRFCEPCGTRVLEILNKDNLTPAAEHSG